MEKHILEFLRKERSLTAFEISEVLSCDFNEVKKLLIEFNIDSNPRDRKFYHIRKSPMSLEQKEFLVGEIISGAQIKKHGKNSYRIIISSKSRQDIYWKKINLGNYVNLINKKPDGYSFVINHNDLKSLRNILYKNNKKIIPKDLQFFSDVTISSMFMNICKQRKDSLRFSLVKYDKESVQNLQVLFKLQGIRSKVCEYERNGNKFWFLSINKRNSKILYEKMQYIMRFYKDIFNLDSQRLHAKHFKNDDIV